MLLADPACDFERAPRKAMHLLCIDCKQLVWSFFDGNIFGCWVSVRKIWATPEWSCNLHRKTFLQGMMYQSEQLQNKMTKAHACSRSCWASQFELWFCCLSMFLRKKPGLRYSADNPFMNTTFPHKPLFVWKMCSCRFQVLLYSLKTGSCSWNMRNDRQK